MEGAVLLFDVDRLQRINDILGYLVGDEVLQRLGQKCQSLGGRYFLSRTRSKFYCITTEKSENALERIYRKCRNFQWKSPGR